MKIALIVLILFASLSTDIFAASNKAERAYADAVQAHGSVGVTEQFQLYTKAAELGHAAAQYNVAMMYANGEAVNVDYQQSAYWFGKSSRQGFAPAQFRLGEMIWFGMGGLAQSTERAAGLFRAAAEQDDPDAQLNLAMCLGSGKGVSWDATEALYWMRAAETNGHDAAAGLRTLLSEADDQRFSLAVQQAYWQQQQDYWVEMAAAYGVREAEEKAGPGS